MAGPKHTIHQEENGVHIFMPQKMPAFCHSDQNNKQIYS